MDTISLQSWVEKNAAVSHSRASGPGGQNVNKVNTRVTLHIPVKRLTAPEEDIARLLNRLGGRINSAGELVISSDETRSQLRNRELAVRRAVIMIEGALQKPLKRRKTKPTRASIERRLSDKKRKAEIKKGRRGF